MQLFWRTLALVFIALAVIGAVLPVMPTGPFVLLAAWAGSQGWPELDDKLCAHPQWGPYILRWRARRAVPRKAKWFATIGMSCSAVMLQFLPLPPWVRIGIPVVMLCVGLWMWSRPDE